MKSTRRLKAICLAAFVLMIVAGGRWSSHAAALATDEMDLTVSVNFTADTTVASDKPFEITLSRPLKTNERIAVIIGQTDVSGLFSISENRFVYDAKLMPLPVGRTDLTVYLVTARGSWSELTRLSMVVEETAVKSPAPTIEEKTAESNTESVKPDDNPVRADESKTKTAGIKADETSPAETKSDEANLTEVKTGEAKTDVPADKPAEPTPEGPKAEQPEAVEVKPEAAPAETPAADTTEKKSAFKFIPSFTIAVSSQPFQTNFPVDTRPEKRATFTDFDLTGSIKTEGNVGALSTESNFDFAGSSFKDKTLQFGTLGEKAPDIDLSSYLTNVQVGRAKFSLGHTSFGGNRHLVSGFSSRGLSINIPINKRFDITAGILNGTSVLGVRNLFGMSNIRHQMQGATLGMEFFPKRPSAMRLEISGFNGYLQALNNVSEGRIVDAEQSRGLGLRFITSDTSQRFKLEFGFARSRFFNPQDLTLDPDGNAVPLAPVSRSAHYLETSYQALKDVKLTKTRTLNLSVAFRYEYVEPLYRSLGASASADRFSQDITVDASIGEITFQAAHARSNDNLRNVPSILKSLTRSNRFSVAFPLKGLLGITGESPFLPRLGYSIDRTHNFGAGIPVNGGFEIDPTTVPDLVNTNQTFTSGWQFKKFNIDYSYNRSFADNRVAQSSSNDQLGWVHTTALTVNPFEIWSFNVGFSFDSQHNFELGTVNKTTSLNFGTTWKPFKNATLGIEASQALAGDLARTSRNRNINYSGQFAYSFSREKSRFKKVGTQAFIRYSDAYVRTRDFISPSNQLTRTKILTAGLTINFF